MRRKWLLALLAVFFVGFSYFCFLAMQVQPTTPQTSTEESIATGDSERVILPISRPTSAELATVAPMDYPVAEEVEIPLTGEITYFHGVIKSSETSSQPAKYDRLTAWRKIVAETILALSVGLLLTVIARILLKTV